MNYFQGFGEQAHILGAKQKCDSHLKVKPFISCDFFLKKNIFGF